jgi:tetratricopeptide (TPR) repeat protein
MNRRLLATAATVLHTALMTPVAAQDYEVPTMDCGTLEVGYGPYDYTNPVHFREKLPIVERAHFTSNVEQLIRGETALGPMNDIAYTLNRFPNHHRALYSMMRYNLALETRPAAGTRRSPECWFDRAMRFKSDDGTVRMLYGIYLHKISKPDAALRRYEEALTLLPNSAEVHYNMGLTYLDLKDYDAAANHAAKAYDLGYPLPGLRKRLAAVGKWPAEQ